MKFEIDEEVYAALERPDDYKGYEVSTEVDKEHWMTLPLSISIDNLIEVANDCIRNASDLRVLLRKKPEYIGNTLIQCSLTLQRLEKAKYTKFDIRAYSSDGALLVDTVRFHDVNVMELLNVLAKSRQYAKIFVGVL